MNSMNGDKPVLIEPGVKYFLNETLKQCNSFRNTHYNTLFNISLFAGFKTEVIGSAWVNIMSILLTNAFSIIGTLMGMKTMSDNKDQK